MDMKMRKVNRMKKAATKAHDSFMHHFIRTLLGQLYKQSEAISRLQFESKTYITGQP
jgi:hypothetical protein